MQPRRAPSGLWLHRRWGGDFEAKIRTRAHVLLADAPPRHTKGWIVLTYLRQSKNQRINIQTKDVDIRRIVSIDPVQVLMAIDSFGVIQIDRDYR
jgi:hypothetical protein